MIPLGRLQAFYVVSPEWDSAPSYEPPEPGCDVVMVCARTKRQARILAVRYWRRLPRLPWKAHRQTRTYVTEYYDEHPFKKLEVEEITEWYVKRQAP